MTLNYNADVVAGEIAAAVGAETLVFMTDVDGVKNEAGKTIPRLTKEEAISLIDTGVADGGMIPKLQACVTALDAKSESCVIDGRQPHALLKQMKGKSAGGTIIGETK